MRSISVHHHLARRYSSDQYCSPPMRTDESPIQRGFAEIWSYWTDPQARLWHLTRSSDKNVRASFVYQQPDESERRVVNNGGFCPGLQLVEVGEDRFPACRIFSGLDGQREIGIERDNVVT